MSHTTIQILSTINAPYGAGISTAQLAEKISDPASAYACDASVFAFFSEINPDTQKAFIEEMGLDEALAHEVASALSVKSGFPLPLAV